MAAVLAAVDSDKPPRRLLLGSPAYDLILSAYEQRVKGWQEWEAVTRSADARGQVRPAGRANV